MAICELFGKPLDALQAQSSSDRNGLISFSISE
jgi:hypothetical protein